MIGILSYYERNASMPGKPQSVRDASIGDDLAQAVSSIVSKARSGFRNDSTGLYGIHAFLPELIHVRKKHLDTMRIYTAQVSRDQ